MPVPADLFSVFRVAITARGVPWPQWTARIAKRTNGMRGERPPVGGLQSTWGNV
jgi:hypothetical protein